MILFNFRNMSSNFFVPGGWLSKIREEFNQLEENIIDDVSSDDDQHLKTFFSLKSAVDEVSHNPEQNLAVFAKEIRKNSRLFIVTTKVTIGQYLHHSKRFIFSEEVLAFLPSSPRPGKKVL